jgi:hypothetical protein
MKSTVKSVIKSAKVSTKPKETVKKVIKSASISTKPKAKKA